ncbi:MAG: SH3 domain-containing protein [Pseudomonadota bacterium]
MNKVHLERPLSVVRRRAQACARAPMRTVSAGTVLTWVIAVATAVMVRSAAALAVDAQAAPERGPSGLPLPRFVSLKADRVNVRKGPGPQYAIDWVFVRAGWPVEVIAEFGPWRRIRDAEGATGWILGAMLSGRRTALVTPWTGASAGAATRSGASARSARGGAQPDAEHATSQLLRAPLEDAPLIARLGPKVMARVQGCDGAWCRVTLHGLKGYVRQRRLWGVYPGERVR